MRELLDLMVSFHIEAKVESIEIGDSKSIAIAVEHKIGVVEIKTADRVRNRPAGLIYKIC